MMAFINPCKINCTVPYKSNYFNFAMFTEEVKIEPVCVTIKYCCCRGNSTAHTCACLHSKYASDFPDVNEPRVRIKMDQEN